MFFAVNFEIQPNDRNFTGDFGESGPDLVHHRPTDFKYMTLSPSKVQMIVQLLCWPWKFYFLFENISPKYRKYLFMLWK